MKMLRPTIFLVVILPLISFSGQTAFAQDSSGFTRQERDYSEINPGYFTINPASIRMTMQETVEEPEINYVKMQEPNRPLDGILVTIENIVNIAEKVWKIVEANKPVVNIDSKYATAYPMGVTSASQMSTWSRPKVTSYAFYAENMYGGVMINVKYKVGYSYNGSYKGRGKYLTAVAVIPAVAEVGWGYKFYMSAAVPDSTITNVGTDTDPIAAMQLKLTWKIATVVKESDGTSVYYVQGDGVFEEIANPWKDKPVLAADTTAGPVAMPVQPSAGPVQLENLKSAATLLEPLKVF